MVTSSQLSRRVNLFLFTAICLGAIGVAFFYFQGILGLAPCPWCIVQRALFLVAAAHGVWLMVKSHPSHPRLLLVWVVFGILISSYHTWLQHQPDESVVCMEGWNFNRGVASGLSQLWTPTGSCTSVDWSLFGQGIPLWTGVLWFLLGGFVLYIGRTQSTEFKV